MMIRAELDTAISNKGVSEGTIGEGLAAMLEMLKPEAAYFHPANGRRAITLVVDVADPAAVVPILEPFWLQLGATVEMFPCMTAEELRIGISRLG
jgi:hypothetical protein